MHIEKTLENRELHKGRVITVFEQIVELENKQIAKREIVRHNGGAAIIAIDSEKNTYIVRQFRKPFDQETIEVPAGKLEIGEDPYICAVRELKEETGIVANNIESLGVMYSTPGFCDEKIYLYLATDLVVGEMNTDADEFLTCEKISLKNCVDMVINGEIVDAKTIICILRAARRFEC